MKRTGFFCFLGIVVLLIVFHHAFLTRLASLSIHAYSVSKWGSPLRYDALSINGSRLTISRPQFENDAMFQAEQVVLDFAWDWRTRILHIDVDIAQPQWVFKDPLSQLWESWEGVLAQEDNWMRTHPRLNLTAGQLTWSKGIPSEWQQVRFDLVADSREGAVIQLNFDPQNDDSNHLELRTASSAKGMEVNCSFQRACCSI